MDLDAQHKAYTKQIGEAVFSALIPIYEAGANPPDMPKEVFHFTDVPGLIGILWRRELWASLASSLNDTSEAAYGVDLAREVLKSDLPDAEYCNFVDMFLDAANVLRDIYAENDPYLVSFCEPESTNLAGHWLHYGHSGKGVAIGLNTEELKSTGYAIYRSIYKREQQIGLLRDIIDSAFFASIKQDNRQGRTQLAAHIAATYVRLVTPRLKDPAFAAENEWRLIFQDLRVQGESVNARDANIQFRPRDGRIVPYVPLPIPPRAITQLVLGASSPLRCGDRSLAILVRETIARDIPIRQSTVPVR